MEREISREWHMVDVNLGCPSGGLLVPSNVLCLLQKEHPAYAIYDTLSWVRLQVHKLWHYNGFRDGGVHGHQFLATQGIIMSCGKCNVDCYWCLVLLCDVETQGEFTETCPGVAFKAEVRLHDKLSCDGHNVGLGDPRAKTLCHGLTDRHNRWRQISALKVN